MLKLLSHNEKLARAEIVGERAMMEESAETILSRLSVDHFVGLLESRIFDAVVEKSRQK